MRIHNEIAKRAWMGPAFRPHPLLKHSHLMSIVPGFLPRALRSFEKKGKRRLFAIDDETSLLGHCHLHADENAKNPTLILLHGLEGSSESSHVLGIAYKAFHRGFNIVRLNMRNCGGSMEYAQSLYHAGLHADILAVMQSLHDENPANRFMLAGYSLGGNLLLNAAATSKQPYLMAVCAVSPSIDLDLAVRAIELPENRLYQDWFLRTMKKKIHEKAQQSKRKFDLAMIDKVKGIREFDDKFTAPDGGFGTADRYYREASAKQRLKDIQVPCLILAAQDDPLVPIESFRTLDISNDMIELLITEHGGHCGFFQDRHEQELHFDKFWAENRVVAFLQEVSRK